MKLLKELFAIHSPSNNEVKMRKFIREWIKSNVPGCSVKGDRYGNMYIVKGDADLYPCVVAHLDQVQDEYPEDYKVVETEDIIFAYSPSLKRRCGLGADDKCGIWIALNCLKKTNAIKVAFFAGEERGCCGSSICNMRFFDDTMYIIEPDRRGCSDLITAIGWTPICSWAFVNAIRPHDFGYSPTHGAMTDVEELCIQGYPNSCINLSCGYYEPHTDNEYVVKEDVINALRFARSIIANVNEPYPNTDGEVELYCETESEQQLLDVLYEHFNADALYESPECVYEYIKDLTKLPKQDAIRTIINWQKSGMMEW